MEDKGQHYKQCVTEVEKCKLLSVDLRDAIGHTALLIFNDNGVSKIMSRMNTVGYGYDGVMRVQLIIKN